MPSVDIRSVPPGTLTRTSLEPLEIVDGTPLQIPVLVLRGARDGPTLYLGSTIHGDELIGIEVIRRVLDSVVPSDLAGTILAVPVQNPLAFRERQRFLPAHSVEGYWLDVHTAFPGASDGEMAGVLAHHLLRDLVAQADYAIDFHAPLHGGEYLDYAFTPSAAADASGMARRLARAFGAPVVIMQDSGLYTSPNMLHEAATRAGVPTFSVEFATNGRITEPSVSVGVTGVRNVLCELSMLSASPSPAPGQVVARNVAYARAHRGGIAEITCTLGQRVRAGDLLGRIRNLWFDEVERITAPCEGIVYRTSVARPLHATERLAGLAIDLE